MKKLKIVILDDDRGDIELLRIYLGRMKDISITDQYTNPLEFLKDEPQLDYNLLISDVEMLEKTGLEVAKEISKKIIFVTGKASIYGNDLLKTNMELDHVIAAIPKPLKFEFLSKAIGQASIQLPEVKLPEIIPREFIRLKIKDGTALIRISDILTVSTVEFEKQQKNIGGGNKKVYLETSSPIVITDISLEEIFKQLNSREFFIVSDSCLVQRKAVMGQTKTKAFVRMNIDPKFYEDNRGGFPVFISESKRSSFITFLES